MEVTTLDECRMAREREADSTTAELINPATEGNGERV
jgi:hypothetical protein